MTESTRQAMERALTAHFASEFDGATLTSWVLQGYGEKFDAGGGYYMGAWPQGQALHVTGGLLDYANQRHAARLTDSVSDVDDDE